MKFLIFFAALLFIGYIIRIIGLLIAKNIKVDPDLRVHREKTHSHLAHLLLIDNPNLGKEMKDFYFLESDIDKYVESMCFHLALESSEDPYDPHDENILKDILKNTDVVITDSGIKSIQFYKGERQSVSQVYSFEGYPDDGIMVFLWYRRFQWGEKIHIHFKDSEKAYYALNRYIHNTDFKFDRKDSYIEFPLSEIMYLYTPKKN